MVPLARRWLGFEQARISFHAVERTFEVRLLIPLPAAVGGRSEVLKGQFLVRDGLLLTALVISQ